MTHITLFPDQTDLVTRVRSEMRRHKSILMQSATGSGKTVMASYIIKKAVEKGSRCGMVFPRRELIRQTIDTFNNFGIRHGVLAAGYKPNPFANVQLMTSGTLARRLDNAPKLNLVAIDECHFGGAELDRIIRHYQSQGTWVVGLSATPMKTNGQGMGEWYSAMIEGPSIRWLMDNERLSDYRLFAPDVPDLSALRVSGGDYVQKDVDSYMMSEERGKVLVGNAAMHYRDHASGLKNVVFCTSIKHAEMTSAMFNEKGIPTTFVHGKLDDPEIKRRVIAFASGDVHCLCNVELLTFGFDLSQAANMDVTVEALSDLRPTKSLPLQLQKWGRALRMKDRPAMIFDHAGNSAPDLHGLPDSDREWTLEARDKKKRADAEKTEPTRQCAECWYVHRPAPCCPNCGFEYPIMGREVEEVDGELVEVTDQAPKVNKKQEVGIIARQEGLTGLLEYAKVNGYKPAWAAMQLKTRGLPVR